MKAHQRVKGWLRGVPLRLKLVTSVLALVAAALVVISVTSAFFLRSYLVDQVDSELRDATRSYAGVLSILRTRQAAGSLVLPSDYVVALANEGQATEPWYDWRNLDPEDLPAFPAELADFTERSGAPFTVRSQDGHSRWRVLYSPISERQVLVVGVHLTGVDRVVGRLVWIDVLVGASVLILLASLGAAIVRTSLRPLVEIEQTAAAIAAGDLTRRVPDPEPGTCDPHSELGRLSRALNAMLTQIEVAFTARAASETAARAAESSARDAAFAAQASEARARRSEERMRQFIADASHELRTPLTTIRGFAELHRQGAAGSPEETARMLRRIEDEAARMGLLVEDLLLLARLDRERPLVLAPVDLRVLAADTLQGARAVAPDRDIAMEVEPGTGDLVVLGDDARLRQVLGNLMTNALTHTPPDTSVTLRLRVDPGNLAVVEVADTGPGLTPEQAERVFERFYRADAARTRRPGGATGTGLGLAIVAALVAAHHGSVDVAETPGGGATFRVRLPLVGGGDTEDD